MNIFLSWSGDQAREVARALREWLPAVLQGATPFMSGEDIQVGEPWLRRIETALTDSDIGILCLTPANLKAPWLLFEAGFLMRAASQKRVVPYLFGLTPTDVPQPLGMLQSCEANPKGTQALIEMINKHRREPLDERLLAKQFEKWWEDLDKKLNGIVRSPEKTQKLSDREILEEILRWVRRSGERGQRTDDEEYLVNTPAGPLIVKGCSDRHALFETLKALGWAGTGPRPQGLSQQGKDPDFVTR